MKTNLTNIFKNKALALYFTKKIRKHKVLLFLVVEDF